MNKLSILFLLLAMPVFVQAQSARADVETVNATINTGQGQEITPRFEAFAGFSYLRLDAGLGNDRDLNGFNSSFSYNFNRIIGATGEFGGNFGNASASGARRDQFFILFGPKFAYRGNSRVTPFAHVLPGVVRQNVNIGANDSSTTQFAMATGGGLDINVTERISVRGAQADYIMTRLGGIQNNVRVSTGLVFKF